MGNAVHHLRRDTVRFWTCFAVVMALFTQVLFPPQVMAAATATGTQFVICTADMEAAPIADAAMAKLFKALGYKPALQGLKCANCVLASVTAVTTPASTFTPAVYAVTHTAFKPAANASPVQARAPPRPHSCGPPSHIQDL